MNSKGPNTNRNTRREGTGLASSRDSILDLGL